MRFSQIITEIRTFEDSQVDCKHFIVRSTEGFCQRSIEVIDSLIESGIDLKKSNVANLRKKRALEILERLKSGEGVSEAFSDLPRRDFSTYPLN